MHEFSVAASVVESVLEFAAQQKAARVLTVRLAIGELTHVEAEELVFCYESITKGTAIEGSALETRGLESVIREVARSHRPQQSSIAVIIQAPNLERLEERHQRRLLEIRVERISDGESQ